MAFSKELEAIIEAALADGVITEKERAVLHKKAQQEGVDPDELDVVIEGRLAKMKREEDWLKPAPPASEKRGNIVKCPNCGEPVPGGAAVCPACGHEFRNVQAGNSIQKFSEGLEKIRSAQSSMKDILSSSKYEKIESFISNYPVPNNSEDLLEFLTAIQPKAHKESGVGGEKQAYFELYSNCINKAKMSFPNDKRFAPYYAYFEKESKKNPGFKTLGGFLLFVVLLVSLFTWIFNSADSSEENAMNAIEQQKTELVEKINSLASPTSDNYVEMRTQLLRINWNRINPKNGGRRAEQEDAAYETFMTEKRAYAEVLNAFYMETHKGESDSALKSLLEDSVPSDTNQQDNVSDNTGVSEDVTPE